MLNEKFIKLINDNSFNKDNKNFMNQTQTFEISKDYKTNGKSKKETLLLTSDKKEPKNINKKNKIKINEKIINNNQQIKVNKYDLISPRYIINNKNLEIPKTERKENRKYKHISIKKINTINFSSLENRYKKFDLSFRNFSDNYNISSKILNKKLIENTLNHDNLRLIKLPEQNNSDLNFYNLKTTNRNKSINHNIIVQAKKKKYLSLINHHNNIFTNKKYRIYSSSEEDRRNNTNIIININNHKYINTDSNIREDYVLKKRGNKLTQTIYIKNNNNIYNCFSDDKEKHKNIKNETKNIAKNINFNEIEKILDLDNKIDEDEIISDIDINKNKNKNNINTNKEISENILENIPEEDIKIIDNENNILIKGKRENNLKLKIINENTKELKKKNKNYLVLNDNSINKTTKFKSNFSKILNQKEKFNSKELYSTKSKMKKITEYFNSNKINNKNYKYHNKKKCYTMRNSKRNSKVVYTEENKKIPKINNNNFNKDKLKEERFIKLSENEKEIKKENEKILKLKEKYENLIIDLKNDINNFNEKKNRELLLFNKYKQEEIEKIMNKKNKKFQINENKENSNTEINLLKQKIKKLKEEIELKDNLYNRFVERIQKEIELQNKKNNDLELKLKIYKSIIDNNENENFNYNDINNFIIIKGGKLNGSRNIQDKNIIQKSNQILENDNISKSKIYNRTFYNLNNKYKYISNQSNKNTNFLSNSDKKYIKFNSHFNKNLALNLKTNNTKQKIKINKNNKTLTDFYHKKTNKSGKNILFNNQMVIDTHTTKNSKNKIVFKINKNLNLEEKSNDTNKIDFKNKKVGEENELNTKIKKKKNIYKCVIKESKKNKKNIDNIKEKNKINNNLNFIEEKNQKK